MVDELSHDGVRLERLMARAGVSKAQLAEKLGVSDTAIGKWIASGQFSRTNVAGICKALSCSADELLGLVAIGSGLRVTDARGEWNGVPIDDSNRTLMYQAISWTLEGLHLIDGRTPEETADLTLAVFDMLVESGDKVSKPAVLRIIRSAA